MSHPALRIGLIDYGMGNLHSVRRSLERLGGDVLDVRSEADLASPNALILPGVGAFDPAMENLESTGLIPHLKSWALDRRPLLGICLGLQLLFESSEEGSRQGLALLPGRVERLPDDPRERIPHMGWAPLNPVMDCPLLRQGDPTAWVYFVHSYAAVPSSNENVLAATAPFADSPVTAMVWRDRVGACQFHPEKSADCGSLMLKRWLSWLESIQSVGNTQEQG
ncbi:imidazole glycerol phosphate synthase subunit HisH [Synechococcus sp. CC9616]|uniref:imidazole glycerol phosphate synthase subunit HisH n=1 Tax=Synechococcus sp. CC9616 TaxID=110663 RepID=UPI0021009BCA|nr:imidazole glycerol phosphate synthase subunit HisH [Synechococcus sp. CC9616]